MGTLRNFITPLHKASSRNYLARMMDEKIHCMAKAKEYKKDYWDGDRRFGYGGYVYDGRWKPMAQALIKTYNLKPNAAILDIGCGKAHLLYELFQLLPESKIAGFDISNHALKEAKSEIQPFLFNHNAKDPLPYNDNEFDLVISVNTLFNLEIFDLKNALGEMDRVGKQKYLVAESYRNDQELFNLQCWALTCESFFSTREWVWVFSEFGYHGDYEFIYFE